jgi:hypothetical protein
MKAKERADAEDAEDGVLPIAFYGFRKARKEHICKGCGGTIQKGTRYWYIEDGEPPRNLDGAFCTQECVGKAMSFTSSPFSFVIPDISLAKYPESILCGFRITCGMTCCWA